MSELNKRIITSFFLIILIIISFSKIKLLVLLTLIVNFLVLNELIKIFKQDEIEKNYKTIQRLEDKINNMRKNKIEKAYHPTFYRLKIFPFHHD